MSRIERSASSVDSVWSASTWIGGRRSFVTDVCEFCLRSSAFEAMWLWSPRVILLFVLLWYLLNIARRKCTITLSSYVNVFWYTRQEMTSTRFQRDFVTSPIKLTWEVPIKRFHPEIFSERYAISLEPLQMHHAADLASSGRQFRWSFHLYHT